MSTVDARGNKHSTTDGKFETQVRAEPTGVDLGARPVDGRAARDLLEAAGLPGRVRIDFDDPKKFTYVDEDGHEYRAQVSGNTYWVSAEDCDVDMHVWAVSPASVRDRLAADVARVVEDARDLRAWRYTVRTLLGDPDEDRATLDEHTGVLTLYPDADRYRTKLSGFRAQDPDFGGAPTVYATLPGDHEYVLTEWPDGSAKVHHAEDPRPMPAWEADGVMKFVADRMGRGDRYPSHLLSTTTGWRKKAWTKEQP